MEVIIRKTPPPHINLSPWGGRHHEVFRGYRSRTLVEDVSSGPLKTRQKSKIELFAKIVNGSQEVSSYMFDRVLNTPLHILLFM